MSDPKTAIDLKHVSIVLSVLGGVVAPVATFTTMKVQQEQLTRDVDSLTDEVNSLESAVERLEAELDDAGDEVKCLICTTHELGCPGC